MIRPTLQRIALAEALPVGRRPGEAYITMSIGQRWDALLDAAYADGWVVLELDANERPVAAYQKPGTGQLKERAS